MPHDARKYRRVTVDFSVPEHKELREYLRKIGKEKLGQNDFIRSAVKFAILAGLTDIDPAPRPAALARPSSG